MTLKPCPFCGGDAILREEGQSVEDSDQFFTLINCKDSCAIRVGIGDNQELATFDGVQNWNTRYEEKKETPEGATNAPNSNTQLDFIANFIKGVRYDGAKHTIGELFKAIQVINDYAPRIKMPDLHDENYSLIYIDPRTLKFEVDDEDKTTMDEIIDRITGGTE